MENKIDTEKIKHYSEGKYSWNDYLKVKQWFSQPDDLSEMKGTLYRQWSNLLEKEAPEPGSMNQLFEKIHYQILLEEKQAAKKRNLWDAYRRVAAILLIPVLLFSALYFLFSNKPAPVPESWAEINAPEGARVEFRLPDGSTGWLNSGSTLKYPVLFGSQREVDLNGEGYFEINHIENSDFTVKVADMDIRVLGTKFNVSAYSGDEFTEVALKEGKVEINGKTGIFNHILSPDDKLTYQRTSNSLQVKKAESGIYLAWKDGYLVLDNESLGKVVGKLERWYNADIEIEDEMLKKYRFKATFRDEPIEEVLRLLALTTPLKYNIEKRAVNNEGVFMKKKVTLKLKK